MSSYAGRLSLPFYVVSLTRQDQFIVAEGLIGRVISILDSNNVILKMAYFSFFSFVALIASLQSISASVDKPKSNKIISQLGTYSISDVTVSGLSSGGYMAVQFHVAFSSVVNGSAIFAGVNELLDIKSYKC